jgi:uncharacterized delta-60 repeat protein
MSFARQARRWTHALRVGVVVALCVLGVGTGPGQAAGSGVVVGMDVVSSTVLTTTQCQTGAPDITAFGIVQPGASAVTGIDCSVAWGSSNDTAALRLYQQDGRGGAMWLQRGTLDTEFGTSGTAITQVTSGANDRVADVAIQPDGSILTVGNSGNDLAMVRYLENGALDPSFGTGGIRRVSIGAFAPAGQAVVLEPDGSFLVGGSSNWVPQVVSVWRFFADGTPDPAFGAAGRVDLGTCQDNNRCRTRIARLPDGRILVTSMQQVGGVGVVVINRLRPDGALDPTFGTAGRVETAVGTGSSVPNSITTMQDGRFIVAGATQVSGGHEWLISRYHENGTLDGSFGTGGLVTQPGWYWSEVAAVALQLDGKLVVVGGNYCEPYVRRYTAAGVLDTAFGTGGRVHLGACEGGVADVVIQPWDQRILVTAPRTDSGFGAATVWRLNPDGSLDSQFGTNGRSSQDLTAGNDELRALALGADGRIIGAGRGFPDANSRFALTRLGGPTLGDYAAGARDWTSGADMFGACLRATSGSGVTAAWPTNPACPATNGTHWNPVSATNSGAGAQVASATTAGVTDARVDLRFGIRIPAVQRPGAYFAPLVIEVVAPGV